MKDRHIPFTEKRKRITERISIMTVPTSALKASIRFFFQSHKIKGKATPKWKGIKGIQI